MSNSSEIKCYCLECGDELDMGPQWCRGCVDYMNQQLYDGRPGPILNHIEKLGQRKSSDKKKRLSKEQSSEKEHPDYSRFSLSLSDEELPPIKKIKAVKPKIKVIKPTPKKSKKSKK